MHKKLSGFTLIELIITVSISFIILTVIVLDLDPDEFVSQTRDAQRISDLKRIDTAISLAKNSPNESLEDNSSSDIVYVSLPDKNGILTDDCMASGEYPDLPALSGAWQYRCASVAERLHYTDGNGWIPINFDSVSGNPLMKLPIDPVNDEINYYTFSRPASNPGNLSLSAPIQSEKYLKEAENDGGNGGLIFETKPIAWNLVAPGGGFTALQGTLSANDRYSPQLQSVGTDIYYVWDETGFGGTQIWTAKTDLNGNGWAPVQRTSSAFSKSYPQLQSVGTKIYYVWSESDAGGFQVWTAEMNVDGTGWVATKRTTSAFDKQSLQLQVVGTDIYYVWYEYDASHYQIWTAKMNIDGTGWVATKRTTSVFDKEYPQLQVVGTAIYYVWDEYDVSGYQQIWTAKMNIDGTGWVAAPRTSSLFGKGSSQLQVVGTDIYYVWYEVDASAHCQIWTAKMNIDGTGWAATPRTSFISYHNNFINTANAIDNFLTWVTFEPQLQVVGTNIYYVWYKEDSASRNQIWTAKMNTDGSGWMEAQQTTSAFSKFMPQFQAVSGNGYYVWIEADASNYYQVWTGKMGL
jgi:hypothetical protein